MSKRPFLVSCSLFFLLLLMFSVFSTCDDQSTIDLEINSSAINFSNLKPFENQVVTINGTITNTGNKSAQNAVVQFFDNTARINNVTLNVSCNSTAIAFLNWSAQIGPNNITLIVDPQNLIAETNETNNNATQNISLSGYSWYVGNIFTSRIVLGLTSASAIFNLSGSSANVLAVDSDSVVNFDSLQALGVRKSGGSASNDFSELDTLLGMTGFNDSIRNLWGIDGSSAKQTTTLRVGSKMISSIPIINSTNTSSFVTGILWETSNDTDGEFGSTDKENIIFVTSVNNSRAGAYGTYDYEFVVPSLLRSYVGTASTIDFYMDVR